MTTQTMQSADGVVVRSVPLGGGALSQSLQGGGAAHTWLATRPNTADEWRIRVEEVRAAARGTDWLSALAPAIAATGRAAERLGRAAANGVLVTTGQQPGLFGGPSYTWSKAMSVLALADELERATGCPVAPIFWAATDDADWVEAAVTHAASSRGLVSMSMVGPPSDGVAMADVVLGDLDVPLSQLRAACGSSAAVSVLAQVESAYVPQATVGAAYVQLLRALLEPLGIAVLDAAHPATRAAADPFLRRALHHSQSVSLALAERTASIRAAGFTPQVEPIDDLTLVFRTQLGISGRERDRVRERIPVKDAARVAREADEGSLGANVLLRPVLERALLPTVGYVAGPGEYAYFAQVSAVAEALHVATPVAIPRWAGEVIEGRALEALDRLQLDESLLRDPHAMETLLAERFLPEGVRDSIDRLRVATETQVRAVRDAVAQADGVVAEEVVLGLQHALLARLDRFERRVRAGVKRREVDVTREALYIRAALRPLGLSPERVLNLVPTLARHGTGVLTLMRDAAAGHARTIVQGTDDPL